jgi:hypothetical protein
MPLEFRHKAVPSALFGVVYRPVADVLVQTKEQGNWVSVSMIVDTGADYTIMPKRYAPLLGIDVNVDCIEHSTQGIGGSETVYLCHDVTVRLGRWERCIPLGFLDRDDIPPLLGRQDFLETFRVIFEGHETIFVQSRKR